MCFLIVVGLLITAIVWARFGPILGLISLVLFVVTGFGWTLVANGAASLAAFLGPTPRRFKKAWQELDCDNLLGPENARSYFLEWVTRYKPMGRSAADYLAPWTECTPEDRASFGEAWHQLGCPEQFGNESLEHYLYQWLSTRHWEREHPDRPEQTPVRYLINLKMTDLFNRGGQSDAD